MDDESAQVALELSGQELKEYALQLHLAAENAINNLSDSHLRRVIEAVTAHGGIEDVTLDGKNSSSWTLTFHPDNDPFERSFELVRTEKDTNGVTKQEGFRMGPPDYESFKADAAIPPLFRLEYFHTETSDGKEPKLKKLAINSQESVDLGRDLIQSFRKDTALPATSTKAREIVEGSFRVVK